MIRILILCPSRETARSILRAQEINPDHPKIWIISGLEELHHQRPGLPYVDLRSYAAIKTAQMAERETEEMIRNKGLTRYSLSGLKALL